MPSRIRRHSMFARTMPARPMPARPTLALCALGCIALAGCAIVAERKAMDSERLMSAAGFHVRFADTSEKLEHLKSLKPQRKLVAHVKDGKKVYVYADAKFCKCLYAGNEAAFESFQQLATEKEMADQATADERTSEEAALNWRIWGPWW